MKQYGHEMQISVYAFQTLTNILHDLIVKTSKRHTEQYLILLKSNMQQLNVFKNVEI